MKYTLEILSARFAICQLAVDAAIPSWANGDFVSITRTRDELSVVCVQDGIPEEVRRDSNWRCLRLVGPFDLTEVGVLASLARSLAAAKVSVFVVGTFDTDYLLVRDDQLKSAISALGAAGHSVIGDQC